MEGVVLHAMHYYIVDHSSADPQHDSVFIGCTLLYFGVSEGGDGP